MAVREANLWTIYVTAWVCTGWAAKRRAEKKAIPAELPEGEKVRR